MLPVHSLLEAGKQQHTKGHLMGGLCLSEGLVPASETGFINN
jgi:hypothetical protein